MTTFIAILMLSGAYLLGALTTLLLCLKFNKTCNKCWNADTEVYYLLDRAERRLKYAEEVIERLTVDNRRMAQELNNFLL